MLAVKGVRFKWLSCKTMLSPPILASKVIDFGAKGLFGFGHVVGLGRLVA